MCSFRSHTKRLVRPRRYVRLDDLSVFEGLDETKGLVLFTRFFLNVVLNRKKKLCLVL